MSTESHLFVVALIIVGAIASAVELVGVAL